MKSRTCAARSTTEAVGSAAGRSASRIMKARKLIIYFAGFLAICVLVMACIVTVIERTPDVPAPPGSTNVRFKCFGGWQFYRYYYRIDNDPLVSINFAKSLMDNHLHGSAIITEEPFVRFPITGKFPKWFNPDSVTNGILITGNKWIYSVVDTDSGRMFYYYGH